MRAGSVGLLAGAGAEEALLTQSGALPRSEGAHPVEHGDVCSLLGDGRREAAVGPHDVVGAGEPIPDHGFTKQGAHGGSGSPRQTAAASSGVHRCPQYRLVTRPGRAGIAVRHIVAVDPIWHVSGG
jgi:hypothetical protein